MKKLPFILIVLGFISLYGGSGDFTCFGGRKDSQGNDASFGDLLTHTLKEVCNPGWVKLEAPTGMFFNIPS